MSRTRQPSTRRIGAAERAITVLDTLADGGELGTNEVARRTGMTPSTVSRQLGTLAASGLVERVDATGRYRLGIRLVHLANTVLARLDVREVARPHLVALVEATGETATLSVPGDEDAITVDFVPGAHQIQPVSRLGRPSIAHATSAGKVTLAFSGRELPDGPFKAYTARTITDRQVLASEIEQVRIAPSRCSPWIAVTYGCHSAWVAGSRMAAQTISIGRSTSTSSTTSTSVMCLQLPSCRLPDKRPMRSDPLLASNSSVLSDAVVTVRR